MSNSKSAAVIPLCPKCGERDKVWQWECSGFFERHGGIPKGTHHWCDRCNCCVEYATPDPHRHVPDDIGPPLPKRKRQYRKSSTPSLLKRQQPDT